MESAPRLAASGGACVVEGHGHARTLKRTISACRLEGSSSTNPTDPTSSTSGGSVVPIKKLAAVAPRAPSSCGQQHQQQQQGESLDDLRAWMTTLAPSADEWTPPCCECRSTGSSAHQFCPCQLLANPTAFAIGEAAPAWSEEASPSDAVSASALQSDREYLSPVNLHASVLAYLQETCATSQCVRMFTFQQVQQLIETVPNAVRYMQHVVQTRLAISGPLVTRFVPGIIAFIADEDLRDASVLEFAGFLRSVQHTLYESMPLANIFANLDEFFLYVLAQFKKYLVHAWLATKRIAAPCEFGKKSDKLFLCMECHREHY